MAKRRKMTLRQRAKKLGIELPRFPTKIERASNFFEMMKTEAQPTRNFTMLESQKMVFLELALSSLAPSLYKSYDAWSKVKLAEILGVSPEEEKAHEA